MNPWRPYPLIRLIIAFIAGILSAYTGRLCFAQSPILPAIPVTIAWLFAMIPGIPGGYRFRWLPGLVVNTALVILGNALCTIRMVPAYSRANPEEARPGIYMATVEDVPLLRTRVVRVTADLAPVASGSAVPGRREKVLVYLTRSGDSENLVTGDRFLLHSRHEPIPEAANPGSFDMRSYFRVKGISSQVYVPAGHWKKVNAPAGTSLRRVAVVIRARLLDILRKNNVEGQEYAVASALLLGYVNEIGQDLMHAYSVSGAMHILSVSGMHVGVIFIFLETILGFMTRRRSLVILRAAIITLCIWFYALLTGLSPPVMRAAAMLSLVVAGKAMKRNPDTLNIVAASLFALLVSDPNLLMDTGFRFSYMAVIGIVLFYRPVYDLYTTSRRLPDKTWSLLAVSLVAQLATFPLGLYVFHQFPNYFLLSNLVTVPLSGLIIYAGIFLLLVGNIPLAGPLTGKVFSWLVAALNGSVRFIGELPGSVTSGVYINGTEVLVIYMVIIFFLMYFISRRKLWLFSFLCCSVILAGALCVKKARNCSRVEVCIYQVKKSSVYDFIAGDRHLLLLDYRGSGMDEFSRGMLRNHYGEKGINRHITGYLVKPRPGFHRTVVYKGIGTRKGNFFQFSGRRFVWLYDRLPSGGTRKTQVDFVIIGNNVRMKLQNVNDWFPGARIVLDGSNSLSRVKAWKEEALQLGIKTISVMESGAFLESFQE